VSVTPFPIGKGPVADLVAQVAIEVAARMDVTNRGKAKNRTDTEKALVVHKGTGTMKWPLRV
jgi:hypothetical protein